MAEIGSVTKTLRFKITMYILIGAVVFSSVIIFVISHYLNQTLTDSLVDQGRLVGTSVAELAAEKLIEEDRVGLKKIVEKYRYLGIPNTTLYNEYILILDSDNQILADTYNGNIPEELKSLSDNDIISDENYAFTLMNINGSNIYDIQLPIKEGLLGVVRVGLKKSYIDEKVQTTLFYIGIIILIGTLAAIVVAMFIITSQVTRPVIHLANAAKEISLGNFNASVELNVQNELQILAAAIDRMRESLKTSLERLKTRSTIGRF